MVHVETIDTVRPGEMDFVPFCNRSSLARLDGELRLGIKSHSESAQPGERRSVDLCISFILTVTRIWVASARIRAAEQRGIMRVYARAGSATGRIEAYRQVLSDES